MQGKLWRRGVWLRVFGYGLRVSYRAEGPLYSDRAAGRCIGKVSWRWLVPS